MPIISLLQVSDTGPRAIPISIQAQLIMKINNHRSTCKYLLLLSFLVEITPIGPLYVPVNTQRNITCHVGGGDLIDRWGIILKNGTELDFRPANDQKSSIPGFTARNVNGVTNTLLITINTTETSVTGLSCYSIIGRVLVPSTINVTIYGK